MSGAHLTVIQCVMLGIAFSPHMEINHMNNPMCKHMRSECGQHAVRWNRLKDTLMMLIP